MKLKIYKQSMLMLMAFWTACLPAIAQEAVAVPPVPMTELPAVPEVIVPDIQPLTIDLPSTKFDGLNVKLKRLDKSLSKSLTKRLRNLEKSITVNISDAIPDVSAVINDLRVEVNTGNDNETDNLSKKRPVTGITSGFFEEREKIYSKSYSAGPNDVLEISNKYGNVTVNTWNKSEFKVDVRIKVSSSDEGAAQKMLDNVVIHDAKEGSTVRFETQFNNGDKGWSSIGRRIVRKIEINYTVFMPAKNALTVSNKYGAVNLPDLYGKVIVSNSYGNLAAKTLSNTANVIQVKYGGANIEGLSGCDLNVAYGSLNLSEGSNLNANVSYGGVNIGILKSSGNINVKYCGGLNIGTLDKSLKNLAINSAYSGIKLGVENLSNIDFDVTVHYGGFNYDDDQVRITAKNPDDEKGFKPTKNYKGHLGKSSNNDKLITINSKYGGVKFE
ncbi:hypothetical protein DJ568_11055 [Mucilaginibacter hurinus]|uniref:Adhesin domain-containing protein n=1 Tax=Mucilaginibacter hurinus TaxID=2201324 RepID=A0A367GND5_9SPHI|nr:hypothetical protein [Mucilaginibacter hurinus]RCH55002.1 hypothetical protein DJ568_11055 [Mucilaginibacter hurinus]